MSEDLIPAEGLDIKYRNDEILGVVYCMDGSSDLRLEVGSMKCLETLFGLLPRSILMFRGRQVRYREFRQEILGRVKRIDINDRK